MKNPVDRRLSPLGWATLILSITPLVVLLIEFDEIAPWVGHYNRMKSTRFWYLCGAIAIGGLTFVAAAGILNMLGKRVFADRPPSEDVNSTDRG